MDIDFGCGMGNAMVKFIGCFTFDALMGANLIIPSQVKSQFLAEVGKAEWNHYPPSAFRFHRTDEAFDNGDGTVLPDRAVTWPDVFSFAPLLKSTAEELRTFCPATIILPRDDN